jgi:hypothetical protein
MEAAQNIPAFKIVKDSEGNRAVKYGNKVIPADIAGLCTGRDRWLAEIECKCRDCGEKFPLRLLQGGGQWCENCQTKDLE